MIEVHPHLFVGHVLDYEDHVSHQDGWAVVHACKEPYHRRMLGYSGRSISNTHPEYLVARRADKIALNMIDVDNPAFFSKAMMDQALDFIDEQYARGLSILIHCNHGISRGPALALVYMAARARVLPTTSLEAAEEQFITCYPAYHPKAGIREHLRTYWQEYCKQGVAS